MRNPKKGGGSSKKKKNSMAPVETFGDDGDVEMASTSASRPKVWRAGVDDVADNEELQFDPSAYTSLHAFRLQWPCLSFDIMRDGLGDMRKEYPHTVFCVAGTQADTSANNLIAVMRLSQLSKMRQRRRDPTGEEEESDSDSSSDEEEGGGNGGGDEAMKKGGMGKQGMPAMQARLVAHHGGINRIRCMPQQPAVTATWGDHGRVQLWDLGGQVRALGEGGAGAGSSSVSVKQAPLQIFSGHKEEGFAMDWSPVGAGRLVTGDCAAGLHLWEPGEGGKWVVDPTSFKGHTGSIEDLQWSPTEANIVASCSADQRMMIWDTRTKGQPGVTVHAHAADVNVLSWNRRASCMIATGADDGSFRIWDLRQLKGPTPESDACVAKFTYHKAAITAIEWSPHDESMLATSSVDNQLTIWDLALERDKEEEAAYESEYNKEMQAEAPDDLPPQLLFVHQGQSDLKELHWHPQIPGMLLSTAKDGFNAFQPSNL